MSENIVVALPKTQTAEKWLKANYSRVVNAFMSIHQSDDKEPRSSHPHGFALRTDGKQVSPDFPETFIEVPIHSRTVRHGARTGVDLAHALKLCGARLRDFQIDAPTEKEPGEGDQGNQ